MTADIHTCSYYCERPGCIRAQRDELRDRMESALAQLQAENERLRAEVAAWEGLHASEVQARQRWQARAVELAEVLRKLEEREQSDEALLRQALEALELRCGTHADERKKLIPALRERLGEGGAMIYAKETGNE